MPKSASLQLLVYNNRYDKEKNNNLAGLQSLPRCTMQLQVLKDNNFQYIFSSKTVAYNILSSTTQWYQSPEELGHKLGFLCTSNGHRKYIKIMQLFNAACKLMAHTTIWGSYNNLIIRDLYTAFTASFTLHKWTCLQNLCTKIRAKLGFVSTVTNNYSSKSLPSRSFTSSTQVALCTQAAYSEN